MGAGGKKAGRGWAVVDEGAEWTTATRRGTEVTATEVK